MPAPDGAAIEIADDDPSRAAIAVAVTASAEVRDETAGNDELIDPAAVFLGPCNRAVPGGDET
jgi:hypothetical protein